MWGGGQRKYMSTADATESISTIVTTTSRTSDYVNMTSTSPEISVSHHRSASKAPILLIRHDKQNKPNGNEAKCRPK